MKFAPLPVVENFIPAEAGLQVRQQRPQAQMARQHVNAHGYHSVRTVIARHSSRADAIARLASRPSPALSPLAGRGTGSAYEQPLVVPQLTHLWQLPLGIMIDPHSGQVGASVRAMKL